MSHPSSSAVQQSLEGPVLARAAALLGLDPGAVMPKSIDLGGATIQLDGWHAGPPPTAFEVFACSGSPKGSQKDKLRVDMLKLALLHRRKPEVRMVVVVTSRGAAAWLKTGWNAEVRREFGIDVVAVELNGDEQRRLDAARAMQAIGNRGRAQT